MDPNFFLLACGMRHSGFACITGLGTWSKGVRNWRAVFDSFGKPFCLRLRFKSLSGLDEGRVEGVFFLASGVRCKPESQSVGDSWLSVQDSPWAQ